MQDIFRPYSFAKSQHLKLINCLLLMNFCFIQGCQKQEIQSSNNIYSHQEAEINQLKVQISKLERILVDTPRKESETKLKSKESPIKSITFRIGSNDDRIRIYWKDGKITDLPCTKEQSIWACG